MFVLKIIRYFTRLAKKQVAFLRVIINAIWPPDERLTLLLLNSSENGKGL